MIGSNYLNISKNLGLNSTSSFFKVVLPLSRPAIFSVVLLKVDMLQLLSINVDYIDADGD